MVYPPLQDSPFAHTPVRFAVQQSSGRPPSQIHIAGQRLHPDIEAGQCLVVEFLGSQQVRPSILKQALWLLPLPSNSAKL